MGDMRCYLIDRMKDFTMNHDEEPNAFYMTEDLLAVIQQQDKELGKYFGTQGATLEAMVNGRFMGVPIKIAEGRYPYFAHEDEKLGKLTLAFCYPALRRPLPVPDLTTEAGVRREIMNTLMKWNCQVVTHAKGTLDCCFGGITVDLGRWVGSPTVFDIMHHLVMQNSIANMHNYDSSVYLDAMQKGSNTLEEAHDLLATIYEPAVRVAKQLQETRIDFTVMEHLYEKYRELHDRPTVA